MPEDHLNMPTIMKFWYTSNNPSNAENAKTTASTEHWNRFARLLVSRLAGAITQSLHESSIDGEEDEELLMMKSYDSSAVSLRDEFEMMFHGELVFLLVF